MPPGTLLNNIVEQDHRAIKRRVKASQRFRSFDSAKSLCQGCVKDTRPKGSASGGNGNLSPYSSARREFEVFSGVPAIRSSDRSDCFLSRLAYVAVSRARYDVQIYTNDAGNLGHARSREVSHAAAFEWDGTGKSDGAESGNHSGEEKGHGSEHAPAAEESHGHAIAMER